MNSIVDLIYLIKPRPVFYLKGNSINLLDAYISGWIYRSPQDINDINIMLEFQGWVEKRYSQNISQSWAKIILFHSTDEYEALNNFFYDFDLFLKEIKYTFPKSNENIITP